MTRPEKSRRERDSNPGSSALEANEAVCKEENYHHVTTNLLCCCCALLFLSSPPLLLCWPFPEKDWNTAWTLISQQHIDRFGCYLLRCAHAMQTSWLQNTYCSTIDSTMLWGGACGLNRRYWRTSSMATWRSWGGQPPSWGQQASPSSVRRRRRRRRSCYLLVKLLLFVGCQTSQHHATVSQGRICSDNCTCYHTEIEVADQTLCLTQSQYADIGPTNPSADPITPGATGVLIFTPLVWLDPQKSTRLKRESNSGSSALVADALNARSTRQSLLVKIWTIPKTELSSMIYNKPL